MPFCASCGSPVVEGETCTKCNATAAPAGAGLSENAASALCYLLFIIGAVLFLVLAPYNSNKRIRFHAFQSLFLGVGWMAVWFAFSIVSLALHFMGAFFLLGFSQLIGLAFLVLWIYMIVTAFQGKEVVLPIIGPLAKKQV